MTPFQVLLVWLLRFHLWMLMSFLCSRQSWNFMILRLFLFTKINIMLVRVWCLWTWNDLLLVSVCLFDFFTGHVTANVGDVFCLFSSSGTDMVWDGFYCTHCYFSEQYSSLFTRFTETYLICISVALFLSLYLLFF